VPRQFGGQMMMPHNGMSRSSLLPGFATLAGRFLLSLCALLLGYTLAGFPVFAQGVPQGQLQTAARARVPRQPGATWGTGASENAGSTQPRVVFEDGQLSISANDSSLADVLYALRACTGADIDIPSGVSAERVTAQLGPGPARKVLADLLVWSSFDYVIQGSETDPLSIQSVTLMVRVKSAPITAPPPGVRAGPINPLASRPVPTTAPDFAPASTDVPEADNHTDAPPPSSPTDMPTAPAASSTPPAQSRPSDMTPGSGAGRSPADMIQELQQMYQQRRLLQQQQNAGASPAPAPASPPPQ